MPHKDQEKNRYHIKINARIPQEDQDKKSINTVKVKARLPQTDQEKNRYHIKIKARIPQIKARIAQKYQDKNNT